MRSGRAGLIYLAAAVVGLVSSVSGCSCGPGLVMKADSPATTVADGTTPALITVTVTFNGKPVDDSAGGTVKATTDKGQFVVYADASQGPRTDDPNNQVTTSPVVSGVAKIQMYSIHGEIHTVNLTYTDTNGSTLTAKTQVTFGSASSGQPASITFLAATPDHISLQNSGGQTTSEVSFIVKDVGGGPAKDGVMVTFAINNTDASIDPTTATTASGTGVVKTVLSSGNSRGSVVVTATVGSITGQSTPITIAGAGVNWKNLSLQCDNNEIGGLQYDGLQINCTVFASDRNGAFVPNTQVTLLSEAGAVPATVAITQDTTSNTNEGTFIYQSQCPWPRDVTPLSTEYRQVDAGFYDKCYRNQAGVVSPTMVNRTVNPRDGRANLVAYVLGEECFRDLNGNNTYDGPNEFDPNCDLGDPFLDLNDNGRWDGPGVDPDIPEGEPYVPSPDGDGGYQGPNGKWDDHRLIWRSLDIVWTYGFANENFFPAATHEYGTLPCNDTQSGRFEFSDINGNAPAGVDPADQISFECNPSGAFVTPTPVYQHVTSRLNDFITKGVPLPTNYVFSIDNYGLPSMNYFVHDSNGCPGGTPPPPPDEFTCGVVIDRTLATAATGGAALTEHTAINNINHGFFDN